MKPSKATVAEFIRHILVGVWTYVATLFFMYLLADLLQIAELLAYAITQVIMFIGNFWAARTWIFKRHNGDVLRQWFLFIFVGLAFRGMNWLAYSIAWGEFHISREIAVILVTLIIYPLKFLAHRNIVFRANIA